MATDATSVTRLLTWSALGVAVIAGSLARAETAPPARPLSVIVGPSPGAAPMERLGPERRNVSSTPLPTQHLRVLWTRRLGAVVEAPVVRSDGTVVVVTLDGQAFVINRDGTDRAELSVGPGPTGAPALLADGTVLVVNAAGEAVFVRGDEIVARTLVFDTAAASAASQHRIRPPDVHRGRTPRLRFDPRIAAGSWVLPLADGGAVVALDREVACLDGRGGVRSRAVSPARSVAPPVQLQGAVALVAEGGQVYTWDFRSAPDAVGEHGSFGGAVEGPVAATTDGRLLTVVDGDRVVALDLTTHDVATWLGGPHAFTGAFALLPGPPETVVLEEMTPTGTRALTVDHEGHAAPFAALLSPEGLQWLPDAGAPTVAAPPLHTSLFADHSGSIAFATVDGRVGVASPSAKVELSLLPCGAPLRQGNNGLRRGNRASAGFVGLVPAGASSFVVACENGVVAYVLGAVGDASD